MIAAKDTKTQLLAVEDLNPDDYIAFRLNEAFAPGAHEEYVAKVLGVGLGWHNWPYADVCFYSDGEIKYETIKAYENVVRTATPLEMLAARLLL